MQRKCPKCKGNNMRVWANVSGNSMFLECKKCGWMSKDMNWTKKAKKEWEKLNFEKDC